MANVDKRDVFRDFVITNNIIKGIERKLETDSKNAGKKILECFRKTPDHVAQIDATSGKQTAFAEMEQNSISCALWMQKQEIGTGDVVAVCTHNHLDAYIPCIASILIGAIYNPWHHEVSLKNARHCLNTTSPKIIFVCESALEVIQKSCELEKKVVMIVVFGTARGLKSLNDIMEIHTSDAIQRFEPPAISYLDGIAMILFSSGTTGAPKGVAHSHKVLIRMMWGIPFIPSRTSKFLWYSSLYWLSGTMCMLRSIANCTTRIIHADFEPDKMCKIIEKFQVDRIFLSPTMFNHVCKSKVLSRYKCESLKFFVTGGAKLTREVLQEFKNSLPHTIFSQCYGLTELGGGISSTTERSQRIDSVGFVSPNVQVKIVDLRDGKALGSDQEGEICAKTPNMMLCYYNNPEATRAIIDHDGWLHTGDKGYYDSNGELFIVDRLKEVMKFRGHQVSPSELEDLLMTHPAVMEVAVVPIPHDVDGDHPMAYVKKCTGSKVTEEELIELSSQLGECKKLWGGVRFIDVMPQTATGKVDRRTLREMAQNDVTTNSMMEVNSNGNKVY
ncbi:hypothetical protein QAD02_017879 [Eretmocerus hayati]|uniref:Uncharacterized protein n=1 Tax=Eretmocerus hayati TaxID=131215 RepID=A0ACC2PFH4_9HYME|nr:hypothetical protein QAD02_017879 [Eretmocerus hayati]